MSNQVKREREREPRMNKAIRISPIRVIDEDGSQLGVMPTYAALKLAEEKALDLVEVQANSRPPVCKIMDYGKHKFEKKKKEKEAKKNQKVVEIKEMKFRPKTDKNDFEVKLSHIKRFLEEDKKVRVTVMFRGREMIHQQIGLSILEKVADEVADIAKVEDKPTLERRDLSMMLAPLKKKQ